MTTHTDRIRQMAQEAGASFDPTFESVGSNPMFIMSPDELTRFAQLVAEDCARVCEDEANEWAGHAAQDDIDLDDERMSMARSESLNESAETIRARYSLKD